jgi:hypothetical protein
MREHIYTEIWERSQGKIKSLYEGEKEVIMNRSDFTSVGDRKSSGYGFRLNLGESGFDEKANTAVARDLARVLNQNPQLIELAKKQGKDIRMRDFILSLVD